MTNLLGALFLRLKKSVSFWIIFGLSLALAVLNVLTTKASYNVLGGLIYDDVSVLTFIANSATASGNGALLATLFVAIFVGEEFSQGAIRNVIVSNKSRTQVFWAYGVVGFVGSVAITWAGLVGSTVFGALFFGGCPIADLIVAIGVSAGMCLVISLAVTAMELFFLSWKKRQSGGIIWGLLTLIFVVTTLEGFFGIYALLKDFPQWAVKWIPFYNTTLIDFTAVDGVLCLIIALEGLVISALLGLFGWLILRNSDIK